MNDISTMLELAHIGGVENGFLRSSLERIAGDSDLSAVELRALAAESLRECAHVLAREKRKIATAKLRQR